MKHFLKETDFSQHELGEIFALAQNFKKQRNRHHPPVLDKQTWAMLFFKNSTRTRVSFEVGIHELGGHPLYLSQESTQIKRGESIPDTARVLSRYVHGLIIRTFDHSIVEEFAAAGSIPVINALTDFLHPCQSYSDVLTMAEQWNDNDDLLGSLKGRKIAYFGDCNSNMANSMIMAANLFGMNIALAGPSDYAPGEQLDALVQAEGFENGYHFTTDPMEAADGADAVYTDVWVSMGDEAEAAERLKQMQPYEVTEKLMNAAKDDAVFMHCLPAHPGQEVSAAVLDGPQSIIFDQAENRLHMQKAILAALTEANR